MRKNRPTRVLFLAWGYSIHAKRRIQIFVDDPSFEVAIVSTYNYNFTNAKNVLLSEAQKKKEITDCFVSKKKSKVAKGQSCIAQAIIGEIFNPIKSVLEGSRILLSSDFFSEIKIRIKDFKILISFLLSPEIRSEIANGVKDFKILKSAVRTFKPDIIFLQTLLYPCYLSYFLDKSLPVIITFWNGDVIWWAKWNGFDRLCKKLIVTHGVKRATAITVNSKMAYDACLNYGAPKGKINLIRYPGVDLDRFFPGDKYISRKECKIDAKYVVLCPRGLGGYLNSDVIIEAAGIVCKKYPDTIFLFLSGVGGEKEWDKHLKRACELGIEKNLRYDGQVPYESMVLYYTSSDAMISVSSNDSLPNCMLEAMACGIPVIMSDIPQIREWITDRHNGFLVSVKNHELLASRIIETLEDRNDMINDFVKINLQLVDKEASSERNIEKIKGLVHLVAY